MFAFLNKGAAGVLALDIRAAWVKLSELRTLGGEYKIESHGLERLPENPVAAKNISNKGGMVEVIQSLVEHCKTNVQLVELVFAGSVAITKGIGRSVTLNEDEIKSQGLPLADQCVAYLFENFALGAEVQGPFPV